MIINTRNIDLYYDEKYEEKLKLLAPDSLKEELDQLDYDLRTLSSLRYDESFCKFDYIIKKTSDLFLSGPNYLKQCSTCGQQYFSYKGHKIQDCNEKLFKTNLEKFEDSLKVKNGVTSNKCISDRILLYLRYGFDTLSFKDVKEKENYVNRSIDLYKKIRGNELYLGKNPRVIAAAIIYLVHVFIGIESFNGDERLYFRNASALRHGTITQKKIHQVFNVSTLGIQTIYKFIRQTENI